VRHRPLLRRDARRRAEFRSRGGGFIAFPAFLAAGKSVSPGVAAAITRAVRSSTLVHDGIMIRRARDRRRRPYGRMREPAAQRAGVTTLIRCNSKAGTRKIRAAGYGIQRGRRASREEEEDGLTERPSTGVSPEAHWR